MLESDLPLFARSDVEFARICGRSPKMVRKYRARGRLVEQDGRIAVHASLQRIRETVDPSRGGKRDRLTAPRHGAVFHVDTGQPQPAAAAVPAPAQLPPQLAPGPVVAPLGADDGASLFELARLEKAERLRNLRLQNEELAGNLVRRDVVERAVFQLARDGREGLEAIVDRIGPALAAACPGLERLQVYAIIEAEHRRLAERLANAADALTVARAAAPATG